MEDSSKGLPENDVPKKKNAKHRTEFWRNKKSADKIEAGTSKGTSDNASVGKRFRNRRRLRHRKGDSVVVDNVESNVDSLNINLGNLSLGNVLQSYGNVKDQLDFQDNVVSDLVIDCNKVESLNNESKRNNHEKKSGKEKRKKTMIFTSKKTNNEVEEKSSGRGRYKKEEEEEEDVKYAEYMSEELVEQGLESGELICNNIRINLKRGYIQSANKDDPDILIKCLQDRNRALEGDLVVIKIKPKEEWENPNQQCGEVVFIKEKIHPRLAIGHLTLMHDKNKQWAMFHPRDTKVPRMKIPFTEWPHLFYDKVKEFKYILFLVKIKEWTNRYAVGTILENLGACNDIQVMTKAILMENDLDVRPYSDEMKQYFTRNPEIPAEEFSYRTDFRKDCVFSIDPVTARDLDDALSLKELPNGNYEIGVHISDVTFYLKEDTPLNKLVALRATSVYMVEAVYHMLPPELTMLCSLLPGDDKLAFSVFFEMTPEAEVISSKFVRTVINSCCQLSYEHAQAIIENPDKQVELKDWPTIHNGFTVEDITKRILIFNKLAIIMRKKRFDSGALRIDQPKVIFSIDPGTLLPNSYTVYENKECHRLVEEFMLLANVEAAGAIFKEYKKIGFLRSHPPPKKNMLKNLKVMLEKVGIFLETLTAGELQKSLWQYSEQISATPVMTVLNHLCAKAMTRAHYYCLGFHEDDTHHYALNVPLYTHFTSPIRRYADCMVHRLLSGILGYTPKPDWNPQEVSKIATVSNIKKRAAKNAGDQNIEMYMAHYISLKESLTVKAVVLEVKDRSFDVIVIDSGINVRIHFNNFERGVKYQLISDNANKDGEQKNEDSISIMNLVLRWPKTSKLPSVQQILSIFSVVTVKLTTKGKYKKLEARLVRPDSSDITC